MASKYLFFLFVTLNFSSYAQSTAAKNVQLFEIEAPQLDTLKTIRVYLPEAYAVSKGHYPVLYMHDAQNLFDNATAFSGEWKIDEFLNSQKGQKVIVVGIDHGNDKRIPELTPFPNEQYGGGGAAAYIDFIYETLKPHIDVTYRTIKTPENTVIMGSSLGGLVSFYAAIKHPDVFGMAGVFSPSFWFSEEIYEFAENSEINDNSRFYFSGGTAEDDSLVPNLQKMKELLLKKGLPEENIKMEITEGGEHNEESWSKEFPRAFEWFFIRK